MLSAEAPDIVALQNILTIAPFQIQFTDPASDSYCDQALFMFAFVLLALGWVVLVGALTVFLVDKILTKIVCCRLCRNVAATTTVRDSGDMESEKVHLNKNMSLESVVADV